MIKKFATMNMTFQQTIDTLSFSIQTLNFKTMYRQNYEIYKQVIVHCEMKQFAQLSFKQQCKILIMIIIILFECSKSKQSKLQRNQIKRYELNKTRTIFKIFEKTNSLKNENKKILNYAFELRTTQIKTTFRIVVF